MCGVYVYIWDTIVSVGVMVSIVVMVLGADGVSGADDGRAGGAVPSSAIRAVCALVKRCVWARAGP